MLACAFSHFKYAKGDEWSRHRMQDEGMSMVSQV